MTTNSATYSETLAPIGPSTQRLDPVRARVAVHLQLTNDQIHRTEANSVPLPPDVRNGGPRRPPMGDIVYWVACVGGACLLLIAATT